MEILRKLVTLLNPLNCCCTGFKSTCCESRKENERTEDNNIITHDDKSAMHIEIENNTNNDYSCECSVLKICLLKCAKTTSSQGNNN